MKQIIFLFIVLFSASDLMAQIEPEPQTETLLPANNRESTNSIYGKLIDKSSGKAVEAASVQLYPSHKKKTPGNLVDGMLTRPNGEFRFKDLQQESSFRLIISALGYKTLERLIKINDEKGGQGHFERDLGNIILESDFKQLKNVTVSTGKPALQMGIDRKIFNVEKSLVSSGGTAIDIMKGIPSVSVDIEGNVELRNSTPQIFIDGRPTILTLDQIPAEHIDKIELITNPSAKFDAASSGGIINIVLKKNKRIGFHGAASLTGGTPEVFGANLNLNLRQGKFNFFLGAGHNQSGGNAKGGTLRENKSNGFITDYFNQYSINGRSRNNNSVRFGTDIFMNNHNSLTVSQNFSFGDYGNDESQDQEYLNSNKILERYGVRSSKGISDFSRNSTRLNFKHNFPKEGKELTVDLNYNHGKNSNSSNIENLFFNPDGSEYKPVSLVWNAGASSEQQFTFQSDFSNPLNENTKIEAGIRSYHNKNASYNNAYANDNGQPIKLPLSNNYAYTEMINAAYVTYSRKKANFSYQLGVRAEFANFDGELIDSLYKFGYQYPAEIKSLWDALFPSFFITRKVGEDDELQFNYTRRIRRPRFWQLNPYIDITDPSNIRQGNPDLRPEYVNSFEFNYSKNYNRGNFLGVLYFRSNPRDITQYSDTITSVQYQQLDNAAVDPNAILNTFINASTTNRYGAEFTLQHKLYDNFEITPTVNLQYRTVNAKVNNLDLSNKGFNWEAKLISHFKIDTVNSAFFTNFSFQLIADYESPSVIPQGKRKSEFRVDFAIRKDFLRNKKASVTFAVSDLFNTRRWGTIYDTEQFYQDSYRRWNVRNFRLSFSHKFGDPKFTLNRGGRRGENNNDF